jgi:RNA polymerase sigma-70 factor, ECF subfamily
MGDRVDRREWLAQEIERQRPYLRGVAYRMLGSLTEADDAVQEVWARLDRRDPGIDDLRGWLTVVVGRICLDMLRARRSRREQYAGTWLPEPVVSLASDDDPEGDVVLADSVGLALLIVLETLSPAERLAFVLHDVFAVPFDEVAGVVGRSPAATRQLASRARRRVRAGAPDPDADLTVQRGVVDAFLVAARSGDLEGLLRVLDPDVVLRSDGGGSGPLARPMVVGALAVAGQARIFGTRFAALARAVIVNGGPGAVLQASDQPTIVAAFTVANGRITAIDLIADPAKLGGLTDAGTSA